MAKQGQVSAGGASVANALDSAIERVSAGGASVASTPTSATQQVSAGGATVVFRATIGGNRWGF